MLITDLLIYHGYTELWLEGKWIKATPAFSLSLCEKFGVLPLDFDVVHDSVLQPLDRSGYRHVEYVRDRGPYADLPCDLLEAEYAEIYPGLFATSDCQATAAEDFEEEAAAERTAQR